MDRRSKAGKDMRMRFSSTASRYASCLLPQSVAAALLLYLAAAAGVLVASRLFFVPTASLLVGLIPYLAILSLLFSLLLLLPVSPQVLVCVIAADAVISLVLCPLFSATGLVPILPSLRVFSVPYSLYFFL